MEQKNINSRLTTEEQQQVAEVIENLPKSEETKVMQEIASNHDTVDVERNGYSKVAVLTTDPVTGESTVLNSEDDPNPKTSEIPENLGEFSDEEFEKFIESYEPEPISYTISKEDVKTNTNSALLGDLENMDDATALELVKLLNKVKVDQKVRYKELPDLVKDLIDNYLTTYAGIGKDNVSPKANEARNILANELMTEYLKNIELNKYVDTFNYKVEHLYDDTSKEISPLFKIYNESNKKRIEQLIADTEDPEKKQIAQDVLSSITAAFDMSTLIEVAPRTKMKKFEVDKPDRVYDYVHGKFSGHKNSLYDLYGCAHTLARHLYFDQIIKDQKEARDTAVKIIILFCKVCQNYNVENPAHYAFMYYFTYNVYLLDMYKGAEYEEYTKKYYDGLKKLIAVLR